MRPATPGPASRRGARVLAALDRYVALRGYVGADAPSARTG